MARKHRLSARQHAQRVRQRQTGTRGFDRGGRRRSIFRSKYAKVFYIVGIVGIVGSLVPLLLVGGDQPSGSVASRDTGPAPVSPLEDSNVAIIDEALEEAVVKPRFDAPPELALEPDTEYSAIMTLEGGEVVEIELLADSAPIHANNFIFLAEQGFYDGLTFHRVIADFVVQGGDPTATGTGSAGYTLPDEVVGDNAAALSLGGTGIISMARGPLGASSSQFFITLTPQGRLDAQGFTAFGRVAAGFDAVRGIRLRDPEAFPTPPAGTRIASVTIERGGAGRE